ncbi:UDP-N-acetylmuramoyl-L-alanyl-D-glutamate--2,6-diaminopimelate ligase [Marinomonas sp. M1K-6]|uniref:UDP-N-acetylmuramoyl-L-alanyl-D-glutamate--2,6-diaminopimelate ligase n=1 Tax=Marinomonas profundi TaxID=2726122 RepID=A0A847QZ25_9GAMM|nr:UDP-N-acetylmuramoyl-L-alanyl-D-glutamate--2,6-diaminopimelate ligase [Marinomonas profundi]NLQ18479.1 UDP-N-acetylmuramoyl-L-alanyl-D-glutamate--2,6-diaminopimelate ligase [Marinomonas profundi]UDV02796.1 UDP-N-acetylmuramoyl-L-alanyl-D-glutamate--2,6-diaminopimelate ligase [Marinomonas profundi]
MSQLSHIQLLNLAGYPSKDIPHSAVYSHLETDSRAVDGESVFFALPGVASNGWDYLDDVVALGCNVAVVPAGLNLQHDGIELISVADPAKLLVACLHGFFGHMPAQIVAVTGTNGKSSICFYIAQLAKHMGLNSGLVGTFGVGPLDDLVDAKQTTPDLLSLHLTLMDMAQKGVDLVAFEASSHALDQGRIEGVPFQTAVFSNLSRDHLDYHGDMNAYALAKQRLFAFPSVSHSIFCLDDDYADFMAKGTVGSSCHYYSEQNSQADFYVKDLSLASSGCRFVLCHPEGEHSVFLPLLGRFNIQNALAALASLWHSVGDKNKLMAGLPVLHGAPGRMDKVQLSNAPLVVVDYAHTPDALAVALQALKAHSSGRLICVFGCGGDRDRGKRPLMMAAALQNADRVWLTSDNPRTESIEQIFADTLAQTGDDEAFHFESDRRAAIQQAIMSAGLHDVVLIAGKGHESYQDIQGVKHHFDDKEEARKVLEAYVN